MYTAPFDGTTQIARGVGSSSGDAAIVAAFESTLGHVAFDGRVYVCVDAALVAARERLSLTRMAHDPMMSPSSHAADRSDGGDTWIASMYEMRLMQRRLVSRLDACETIDYVDPLPGHGDPADGHDGDPRCAARRRAMAYTAAGLEAILGLVASQVSAVDATLGLVAARIVADHRWLDRVVSRIAAANRGRASVSHNAKDKVVPVCVGSVFGRFGGGGGPCRSTASFDTRLAGMWAAGSCPT